MRVLKRLAEGCTVCGKFRSQPVWIRCVNERIQPQVGMARMVWHRCHAAFRFNEYLRTIAADDCEKRTYFRR